MKTKQWKRFGQKLKKVKTWEKATDVGSKGLNIAGDAAIVGGTLTGQPEVVAAGAGLKGAGYGVGKVHGLLKTVRK